MVKGCQRRIILLRDAGSDMFEEAYFILKPERTNAPEQLMIAEANRIITEQRHPPAARPRPWWLLFLGGLCTGGGLVGLLWLLVL